MASLVTTDIPIELVSDEKRWVTRGAPKLSVGEVGDARWRGVLDTHDYIAGRLISETGGRLVKSTGDGVLATFEGPGRGIRFSIGFRHHLHRIALTIRSAIHTGEVEMRGKTSAG